MERNSKITSKVMYIEWMDSETANEWTPLESIKIDITRIHSVGILVKEDSKNIVLSHSYDPANESYGGYIQIPKCSILKKLGKSPLKKRVVYIEWIDSEATNEWVSLENVEINETRIYSIGILVKEDEKHVAISHSYDPENDSYAGYMKIPKCSIQKMMR